MASPPPWRRSGRGSRPRGGAWKRRIPARRSSLREVLQTGSLLLDAAMGTALIAQGLSGRAPAWNLSHPDQVRGVHLRHVAAGAEMVLTNTFVGASGEEAAAAVRLARESGARYVAGSLWAGLEDLA